MRANAEGNRRGTARVEMVVIRFCSLQGTTGRRESAGLLGAAVVPSTQ
jgi:hypothetical protein